MTRVTFAPILLAKAYHMVTLTFTGGRGLLGKEPEYLNRSSVPVPKLLFQFLIFKKIPRFWDLFMMLSVHIVHYFSQLQAVRHGHIPHLTYYSPRIRPLLFPAPWCLTQLAVTTLVCSSFGPAWEFSVEWMHSEMGLLGLRVPCHSFQDEAHM